MTRPFVCGSNSEAAFLVGLLFASHTSASLLAPPPSPCSSLLSPVMSHLSICTHHITSHYITSRHIESHNVTFHRIARLCFRALVSRLWPLFARCLITVGFIVPPTPPSQRHVRTITTTRAWTHENKHRCALCPAAVFLRRAGLSPPPAAASCLSLLRGCCSAFASLYLALLCRARLGYYLHLGEWGRSFYQNYATT